ncbi:unnamed protein product [Ceratitis capitata]|uniref:(Mediterranean fruit fly) hypothetical protein n=1 Tax=Ceratitis capitata TaxID=7213 RepID=A0A811USA2_CERCA|nr:unnamed protein product [Ceratitis capitata]
MPAKEECYIDGSRRMHNPLLCQSIVSTPPIIATGSRNGHLLNCHDDLDNSHVSITEITVHAGPDEPIAVTTKLGRVAYGSAPSVSASGKAWEQ